MHPHDEDHHLSSIQTQWTLLFQAAKAPDNEQRAIRQELTMRYYRAAYHYLLSIVGIADVADELIQEFAVRFLEGHYEGADPDRRQFRDYLKTSLRHLASDYWRRQKKHPEQLPSSYGAGVDSALPEDETDRAFIEKWREELLGHAWQGLDQLQQKSGTPYYAVLHHKANHPQLRAEQLAEHLCNQLGKSFTESGVRQLLHRAREHFAELLVAEVARSIPTSDIERIEQELDALDLRRYCRSVLRRWVGHHKDQESTPT